MCGTSAGFAGGYLFVFLMKLSTLVDSGVNRMGSFYGETEEGRHLKGGRLALEGVRYISRGSMGISQNRRSGASLA